MFKQGGFRRQNPAEGLCWYRGVGPAWQSDLDLPLHPWSFSRLTPKCGWWASVRIQTYCPSAGLPPGTAASWVRGWPGSPSWGAGDLGSCHLLSWGVPIPAGEAGHKSRASAPESFGLASLALLISSPWGARLGKGRAQGAPSDSSGPPHQHHGLSKQPVRGELHTHWSACSSRDSCAGAWRRASGTWEDHVEEINWVHLAGLT